MSVNHANEFKNNQFKKHAEQYHSYYVNRFMGMKCAVDLLRLGMFPNAKEVTETFGAFEATKYFPYHWKESDINLVSVGDGCKPRTAATFACRTRWNCHSIDPALRKTHYGLNRLTCYNKRVEEVKLIFKTPVLIVAVHSHAKLQRVLEQIIAPERHVIAIPCCVPQGCHRYPNKIYRDENVWSPCNEIRVWNKI